jgi:hypothetical protein
MKLKHTENAKYQNFTNSTITRRLSGMNCASFGVCAAATLFAISLQSAHAATLVQYDFTGDTLTPTTFLPGITASNFSAANTSGGAFNAANSGPSGAPSYRMIGVNDTVRTDYFSFTTDATVTLNSVTYETFDFYQNTFLSPTKYAVSYTISGGGSEVFVEDAAASVESGGPTNNMFHTVINFADFTTDQSVEWRIYGYAASNNSYAFRVDDVAVTGNLVPEPSSSLLVGLGVAGMLLVRRRRTT